MADDMFAEVENEGNVLDIDKAFDRLETKGEEPAGTRTAKEGEATGGDKNTQEAPKESKRWAEMRREVREAKAAAAEAKREAEAIKTASSSAQPPAWWLKQYGDTPESKQRYATVTQKDGELDWIKNSIMSELDQRNQAEQNTAREGEEYVETQLQELTDEGEKFDRNELLKFMVDFQDEFGPGSLLDKEGNYDFRKALKLMERFAEDDDTSVDTKKALAGQASKAKAAAPASSKIPVVSRRDLRRGWRDMGI